MASESLSPAAWLLRLGGHHVGLACQDGLFLEGRCIDKGDARALPAIWTEQAKFKEGADKMQAEVAKLSAAAKTGNLDAIKTAFGAAGQTCKACHDDFRKE